jgi:DsbC/DsbD-like thiol-disulfide interchange protein
MLASAQSVVVTEHVRAELLAHAPFGVVPGKPVWLGLSLQHEPHWHTYWKNPGDSGLPTTLSWDLPDGVHAGEIQWPTPKRLPYGPLLNYGYDDRLLLPVSLTIPENFPSALDVKLRDTWLVCGEICIPESGEFSLHLPAATPIAAHASQFNAAAALVPVELAEVVAASRVDGQMLVVDISNLPSDFVHKDLQLFAEIGGVIDHAAKLTQHWEGDRWTSSIPLSAQRSESPALMPVVLVARGNARGVRVEVPIAQWKAAASRVGTPTDPRLE